MTSSKIQNDRPRLARLQGYLASDRDNDALRGEIFEVAYALDALDDAKLQVEWALAQGGMALPWMERQARLLQREERYGDAQAVLADMLAQAPSDPRIRLRLCEVVFLQGQFEEAIAVIQPVVDHDLLRLPDALALWMRSQQRLGRADDVLRCFVEKSAQFELPAEAWGLASLVAFDCDRPSDAQAWAHKALALEPHQREASITQGSMAMANNDFATARGWFDACLQTYPSDGRSWMGLGLVYTHEHNFDQSIHAYEQALKVMPRHLGTWISLGWSQFFAQEIDAAQHTFEQALVVDRNFAESHGCLAVILALKGNRPQATRHVDLAFGLDRNCVSAAYAKELLRGDPGSTSLQDVARRMAARMGLPIR